MTLIRNEIALIALEEALTEEYGDLSAACRRLQCAVGAVHRWMAADPEVATRIKTAQTLGWSTLEGAATQRAVHGVEEPVYQKGELVGYKTVYSDSLLSLMLKARVPGYAADASNHGGGVTVNVAVMPRAGTYEEWVEQRDLELQRSLPAPPTPLPVVVEAEYVELPNSKLRDIL